MMKICRAIGGEGEPWARMHGTLPLGQQHYHFINPAGEVEGCAHYNHFINRGRWRAQQCTLISPLHTAWPSIHPNCIFALTPISSDWKSLLKESKNLRRLCELQILFLNTISKHTLHNFGRLRKYKKHPSTLQAC